MLITHQNFHVHYFTPTKIQHFSPFHPDPFPGIPVEHHKTRIRRMIRPGSAAPGVFKGGTPEPTSG